VAKELMRESIKQRNDFYSTKRSRRRCRDRKKPPKPRWGDATRFLEIRCAMPPPPPHSAPAPASALSPRALAPNLPCALALNLLRSPSISRATARARPLSPALPSPVPQSKNLFSGISRGEKT